MPADRQNVREWVSVLAGRKIEIELRYVC